MRIFSQQFMDTVAQRLNENESFQQTARSLETTISLHDSEGASFLRISMGRVIAAGVEMPFTGAEIQMIASSDNWDMAFGQDDFTGPFWFKDAGVLTINGDLYKIVGNCKTLYTIWNICKHRYNALQGRMVD